MKKLGLVLLCFCSALAAEVKIENTLNVSTIMTSRGLSTKLRWFKSDYTYVTLYNGLDAGGRIEPWDMPTGTYSYYFQPLGPYPSLNLTVDTFSMAIIHLEGSDSWGASTYDRDRFYKYDASNPRQNISLRAQSASGKPAIGGFTLTGNQWVLVRVIGPGLKQFGVTEVAPKPKLTIYKGSEVTAQNTGWTKQGNIDAKAGRKALFELVGAFPLSEADSDCAYLGYFGPGVYTIHGQDADGKTGEVLIEVYYLPIDESLAGQVLP